MFILIMSVALDLPGTQILSQQFPIPIPYAEATSIAAVCCHFGAMLTPGFFLFFSIFFPLVVTLLTDLRTVSCPRD
jgi:hypothetical protein